MAAKTKDTAVGPCEKAARRWLQAKGFVTSDLIAVMEQQDHIRADLLAALKDMWVAGTGLAAALATGEHVDEYSKKFGTAVNASATVIKQAEGGQ